ncbi:hypothetical protein O9K51_04998 [Purpureocillium lavendulum]|uniref:Uncharacterized protein n=1 Tax=Purpureocillium lavendulum TaxID=1247861 RepID=A0AB34FQC1_9HYPO|nr:hypothetical protein O9K51_04998 [Purpureocillium lavendulum]
MKIQQSLLVACLAAHGVFAMERPQSPHPVFNHDQEREGLDYVRSLNNLPLRGKCSVTSGHCEYRHWVLYEQCDAPYSPYGVLSVPQSEECASNSKCTEYSSECYRWPGTGRVICDFVEVIAELTKYKSWFCPGRPEDWELSAWER